MARKKTDIVQLKLRFPEALRRQLEREAKRHGRSLNAEIVSILSHKFLDADEIQKRARAMLADILGEGVVAGLEQGIGRPKVGPMPSVVSRVPSVRSWDDGGEQEQ
jgi:plasmid stability protein